MKPPTIQQVIEYQQEKNWYLVDPVVFWQVYEANEWHDRDDVPVKRWKGKMVTWHYRELAHLKARGVKITCRACGRPGEYCTNDDTGQRVFWCSGHKPQPKPLPAEHPANTIKFKQVPDGKVNINNERNRQTKGLGV